MRRIAIFLLLTLTGTAAATSAEAPPYDREEIRFSSGRFGLVGDLLTPPDGRPHPAIVYVWGAGPTNRKAHIESSPILQAFLAGGFAVLLYDKPGSGQSTGALDNRHLFADLASILIDAIGVLKQHRAIDPAAIVRVYATSPRTPSFTAASPNPGAR